MIDRIKYDKKLVEIYRNKILPEFLLLEEQRKRFLQKSKKAKKYGCLCKFVIFLLLARCIGHYLFIFTTQSETLQEIVLSKTPFLFFVFIPVMFVLVIIFHIKYLAEHIFIPRNYNELVLEIVAPNIASVFGDIKWSSIGSSKSLYDYVSSGLIETQYVGTQETNSFRGILNGVDFEFSELVVYNVDKNRRSASKAFEGMVARFSLSKKFRSHTLVTTNGKKYENLDHTILEDVVFEKKYDVYTNNEVEARYLITPSFMERFNNIQKVFKCKSARCAFFNGELLLALEGANLRCATGDIYISLKDYKVVLEFYNKVMEMLDLIEYFKLDNDARL